MNRDSKELTMDKRPRWVQLWEELVAEAEKRKGKGRKDERQ
jgi:hypothetical protein